MSVSEIRLQGHVNVPRYLDLGSTAPVGVDLSDVTYRVIAENGLDTIYLRPGGYSFEFIEDLDSTQGDLPDSIYLTGDYADYTKTLVTDDDGVAWLQLTRGSGDAAETVRIVQTSIAHLVFGDGTIKVADIVAASDMTDIDLDSSLVSSDLEIVGQVRMVSSDGSAQTFVVSTTGTAVTVAGSSDIDKVYIAPGQNVDVTALGGGKDLIYMPGNWGDYQKTVSGTTIIFTRTISSETGDRLEQITVSAGLGSATDRLVFRDGAIDSNKAKAALQTDGSVGTDGLGTDWDSSETSPDVSKPGNLVLTLADDTGNDSSDHLTLDGTMNVSGLSGSLRWQYSLDGGESWTTVHDMTQTSFVVPGQAEGIVGRTYEAGDILVREVSANGVTKAASTYDNSITVDTDTSLTSLSLEEGQRIVKDHILQGQGEVGATVEASWDNGASYKSTVVDASGWFNMTLNIEPGSQTITVNVVDIAGNVETMTFDVEVFDAPDAVSGLSLVSDTGRFGADGITSDGTMKVSGLWPYTGWEYSLDGGAHWQAGSGDSFVLPGQSSGDVGLTYATGQIQVRQVSTDGQRGDIFSYDGSVTVDTKTTLDVEVSDGTSLWAKDVLNLKVESDAVVTLLIDGVYFVAMKAIPVGDESVVDIDLGVQFTSLGAKTLTFEQVDSAGNKSVRHVSVSVDRLPIPTFSVSTVLENSGWKLSADGVVTVEGLLYGFGWEYTLDGGASWQTGFGNSFVLPGQGETNNTQLRETYEINAVQVRLTTPTGIVGAASGNPWQIEVDDHAVAPGIDFFHQGDLFTKEMVRITAERNAEVTLLIDGVVYKTMKAVPVGEEPFVYVDFDVAFDSLGDKTLSVKQVDMAGNTATAQRDVTVKFLPTTNVSLGDIVNGNGAAANGGGQGDGGFAITGAVGGTGDYSGYSVSGAGDVNGDGLDDVIIGALYNDGGALNSGRSYVVFGKKDTAEINLVSILNGNGTSANGGGQGAGGFAITGELVWENNLSGYSVSGAGDVNGDGLGDLIIGAPYHDAAGTNAGRSYVVFGKKDTAEINLVSILNGNGTSANGGGQGAGGFAITGEENNLSGFSVSGAGDVNGDGLGDLIIGAPYHDAAGTNAGRSYVVFGKKDTAEINLGDVALGLGGFAITGERDGDVSGWSVSGAGDVNGDGLDDLIIGALMNDTGGFKAGRSYVVFGKKSTNEINLGDLDLGVGGFAIAAGRSGDKAESGRSVSNAGDVNGDGLDDLIIGAPGSDAAGTDAGRSYVVFGKKDTTEINLGDVALGLGGFAITGERDVERGGDQSGWSVSGAGDVNGDGLDDLIIGAPGSDAAGENAGRSYVVFGKKDTAEINLADVASGFGGFAINAQNGGDRIGRSVSAAGDVNNDGYDDVIVGAPLNDAAATDAGRSYVIFGGPFGHL